MNALASQRDKRPAQRSLLGAVAANHGVVAIVLCIIQTALSASAPFAHTILEGPAPVCRAV